MFHAVRHSDNLTASQTEGQTDMTKLIIAFRNVANAPKIRVHCAVCSEFKESLVSFRNFAA